MKTRAFNRYKQVVFAYIPIPWALLCAILLTTDGITWFGHLAVFVFGYFSGVILALVIYNAYDLIKGCFGGLKGKGKFRTED
jgi:hypothetical protein